MILVEAVGEGRMRATGERLARVASARVVVVTGCRRATHAGASAAAIIARARVAIGAGHIVERMAAPAGAADVVGTDVAVVAVHGGANARPAGAGVANRACIAVVAGAGDRGVPAQGRNAAVERARGAVVAVGNCRTSPAGAYRRIQDPLRRR